MIPSDKILIVDDNIDNVRLLAKRFKSLGYRVDEAYDGVEALERVMEDAPDLIILDIMMPKLDGFEVCRRLKSDAKTKFIPIIMLTAKREVPSKIKGFDTGADDYITKPFNPRELVARVKGLLQRRYSEQRKATADKLGALEQMAEGVAHEVRNPMVTIGGFARRIRDRLEEGDPLREYAQHIIKEVERLEKMVEEIARFKALMIAPYEKLNICNVIEETVERWKEQLEAQKIEYTVDALGQCDYVMGDRVNLQLALSNLIRNSIEAMDEGGHLTIIFGPDPGGEDRIMISVVDDGQGIPREELPNVMDPFFTSKMAGAGMGLTMVHRIVTRHGGEVHVHSDVGKGTMVTFKIPRLQEDSI